jgi:hypothetical protein
MMMMMAMVVVVMNCMNYAVSLTSVGFSINLHVGVAAKLELFSNFMVNELYRFIGPTRPGILLCFPV